MGCGPGRFRVGGSAAALVMLRVMLSLPDDFGQGLPCFSCLQPTGQPRQNLQPSLCRHDSLCMQASQYWSYSILVTLYLVITSHSGISASATSYTYHITVWLVMQSLA